MIERFINRLLQVFNYIKASCWLKKYRSSGFIDLISMMNSSRLPSSITEKASKGLKVNSSFLAGTSIRVICNKNILYITAIYSLRRILENMSPDATSGIDVYQKKVGKWEWVKTISPRGKNSMVVNDSILIDDDYKEIMLVLPAYAIVKHLFVERDIINQTDVNWCDRPELVLYGSSITQGCAASRPGLSYGNILKLEYGHTISNYGFSESAKGEDFIIEHIAKQNSKVIVMEYDHNATVDELERTHLKSYLTIRKFNPSCYIIFMSRLSGGISITREEEEKRISIIENTYRYAKSKNDNNVFFIRGCDLTHRHPEEYLEDNVHPNDKGMRLIADNIEKIIKEIQI